MSSMADFSDDTSRWRALETRDPAAEGAFLYAVRTTGIFCRPGCASRRPRRANVEFFETCRAATQAGYRPCKRCRPDTLSPRRQLISLIVDACRELEASETTPSLDQLAARAGLSRWHFQRRFRDLVGITPKQYALTHRSRRFRASLSHEPSVTAAIYDAGFSSSSRAYDTTYQRLAMTPSCYREGAAGLTVHYGVAPCRLGWVLVAATDTGLCAVEFGAAPEPLHTHARRRFHRAILQVDSPLMAPILQRISAFIDDTTSHRELPADILATASLRQIWQVGWLSGNA